MSTTYRHVLIISGRHHRQGCKQGPLAIQVLLFRQGHKWLEAVSVSSLAEEGLQQSGVVVAEAAQHVRQANSSELVDAVAAA